MALNPEARTGAWSHLRNERAPLGVCPKKIDPPRTNWRRNSSVRLGGVPSYSSLDKLIGTPLPFSAHGPLGLEPIRAIPDLLLVRLE